MCTNLVLYLFPFPILIPQLHFCIWVHKIIISMTVVACNPYYNSTQKGRDLSMEIMQQDLCLVSDYVNNTYYFPQ